MKVKDPELFRIFKEFLTTYLSSVRKKSNNTIASYRYAINIYLEYLQEKHNKSLSEVTVGDFNQAEIVGFLEWLKNSRGNAVTTINQRLSHIKSFCSYLVKKGKMEVIDLNDICEIDRFSDNRKIKLLYLSIEDVRLVLKQPDTSKKNGVRDKFYIALLYDSGCRNQEILDLKVKDFVIKRTGEAELHVIGKGNKHRVTPVTKDVVKLFQKYCQIYHSDISKAQDNYLFYIVRKNVSTQMSDDNVQRFLKTYEKKAQNEAPDILHLHPHLFRRTRAMHLYTAGVPLPLVAEWLGHNNLETTQIYAQATMEMKRNAAEKLANDESSVFKNDVTFKYADDDEVLRKLSGLK